MGKKVLSGFCSIGIKYIDAVKSGSGASVRYGTCLARFSLTISEGSKATVILLITCLHTLVPEILCIALISYIFNHAGNLSIFNFIKQLSAKLKVVTLLINRIRTTAQDVNSFFYAFDHIMYT